MIKTPQPEMMVHLRPIWSARSPAMRAPKNVPADKTEVMSDFCHDGKVKSADGVVAGSSPVWRVIKYGIPRTPFM